jgi:hypothetical protein
MHNLLMFYKSLNDVCLEFCGRLANSVSQLCYLRVNSASVRCFFREEGKENRKGTVDAGGYKMREEDVSLYLVDI